MLKYASIIICPICLMIFTFRIEAQNIYYTESDNFTFNTETPHNPPAIGASGFFTFKTGISGFSQNFSFNTLDPSNMVSFICDKTDVLINENVQFTDLSGNTINPNSHVWNFGDFSTGDNRFQQNPVHSYSKPGKYNISLTIGNAAGLQFTVTKEQYIAVKSASSGISLKIVKTNKTSGPVVAKVGYYYTVEDSLTGSTRVAIDILKNDFLVDEDGNVNINSFPTQEDLSSTETLLASYNNEIILFSENNKRIGSIYFEYLPEKESTHVRNAVLIFHNDADILTEPDGRTAFPYNKGTSEYDKSWVYFEKGEYPVSMLIPPNNIFRVSYDKMPILLVHGWEGKYRLIKKPDADPEMNETSYWFTTVKELNDDSKPFDAWQYYYPYNSAHRHLAICFKNALQILKDEYDDPPQKIGLVTHSMGGLVALRYLTQFSTHAQDHLSKVLFSAPPAHGSLGANFYYKTTGSYFLNNFFWEILRYDKHAPSVRDMKLGSDATWFLHSNLLPNLSSSQQNDYKEDYFVLLGTTWKHYTSDILGGCAHQESKDHHDGIASISSGSLLDHQVGFATIHGNHNDMVHMQSKIRDNPTQQNIGSVELLPDIITEYFTSANITDFIDFLKGVDHVDAVVRGDKHVEKPEGLNLANLYTSEEVNFQKGIINVEFSIKPISKKLFVYYYPEFNLLRLKHSRQLFPKAGREFLGIFIRNENSEGGRRYYFNDDPSGITGGNKERAVYNGNGISINQGPAEIWVNNRWGNPTIKESFDFNYCETVNLVLEDSKDQFEDVANNFTDTKERLIVSNNKSLPDSLLTAFYIDDQTEWVDFRLSSFESVILNFPLSFKMKLPDGTIADTTFPGSQYNHYQNLGNINMKINNPMPGQWHVWLESNQPSADTLFYSSLAFIESDVYAHLPDSSVIIAANSFYELVSGLQVNDFDLTVNPVVKATVFKPDGNIEFYDISETAIIQDSSFIFTLNYFFEIPGEYLIKYNIDGVYNNFDFERCLYHQIEAVDTIPVFSIPDISLSQYQHFLKLDLVQYLFNEPDYDTLYFSQEIIFSNLDSSAFQATLDSLALSAYLYANLSDTGTVTLKYTCYFDDQLLSDTLTVKILLPELSIADAVVSDLVIKDSTELLVNYTLNNSGNYHTGAYKVRYLLTQDSLINFSDICIGEKSVLHHPNVTPLNFSDVIQLQALGVYGNYYFQILTDANTQVKEINDHNNQYLIPVSINPPPNPPAIISAEPDSAKVHLTWSSNQLSTITGYIIHFGTDTLDVLSKIFTLSADTAFTVENLVNEINYYFAVSSYRVIGNESELSAFVSATPTQILYHQVLNIPAGWSGISSFIIPAQDSIQSILFPIYSNLIILQSEFGFYWPGENINTILNWNTYLGYKIKVSSNVGLTITGSNAINKNLSLDEGWNLIPVLSECAVIVDELFFGKDVVVIKDIVGEGIYWPLFGINSLMTLNPGKAYFVLMGSAGEIMFPECDGFKLDQSGNLTGFDPARAGLSGLTWPATQPTTSTHSVAVPAGVAGELFQAGDIIGVFDQEGNCSGLGIWQGESAAVTLFGNDPTTTVKDGFAEGESLQFRLYRTDSGEEFDLEVTFDQSMPNTETVFATNGLSAISGIKMSAIGKTISGAQDQIRIIPNPAKDEFLLVLPAKDFSKARLEIYRADGQFIQTKTLTTKETRVDINNLTAGVYLLKVEIDGRQFTKRLVKY
jgi:PKD repeat protein